jgi:hypothetical protein
MAFRFNKLTLVIKKKISSRRQNRYQKLERTPSEEELDNSANENLERKIREGLKQGKVIIVLPTPICAHCKGKIQL